MDKTKTIKTLVIVAVVLLVLLVGFFLYWHFVLNAGKNYRIENKYYGFGLETPKNWVAISNTTYSEDNIGKTMAGCDSGESNNYEIGAFRFESQKYPEDFTDSGYLVTQTPSGIILEVTIDCASEKKDTSSNSIKVAGQSASEETLNSPLCGTTKSLSFYHGDMQYIINEYIYVSPSDKSKEKDLRKKYSAVINKAISSFTLIK